MTDYLAENQCHKCGKKLNTGFKCEVCDTMVDKKERILVLTTHNKDGEWTQDGCFANDKYAICSVSMTCQEAIEVIKKSLEQIQCWPNSFNDIIAEAALKALLKGVKR